MHSLFIQIVYKRITIQYAAYLSIYFNYIPSFACN